MAVYVWYIILPSCRSGFCFVVNNIFPSGIGHRSSGRIGSRHQRHAYMVGKPTNGRRATGRQSSEWLDRCGMTERVIHRGDRSAGVWT